MSKANQLLAKLRTMAGKAGEAIFERAGMAAEILADKEWIETEHKGDLDAAEKAVEETCFPELGKAFPLTRLLAIRKAFPTLEEWRERKYNLQRLSAELYEANKRKRGPRDEIAPRTTRKVVEEKDEKIEELSFALKRADASASSMEEEITRLRSENITFSVRVARLEGRVEELQRENAALQRLLSREPVSAT
jgi:chromosome segregation ATPase